MAKKKKTTKRGKAKYPALDPSLNLKSRYELIADIDYLDKLSDKEKTWLNKFTEEYVNAKLDTENPRKNFHSTKEMRKDCYDRNNARNRCMLTKAKASNNCDSIEELKKEKIENIEDKLIADIDSNEDN